MKQCAKRVKGSIEKMTVFICAGMIVLAAAVYYMLERNEKTLAEIHTQQALMASTELVVTTETAATSFSESQEETLTEVTLVNVTETSAATSPPTESTPRNEEQYSFFECLSGTTCSNIFNGGYVASDGVSHYSRGQNGMLWKSSLDDVNEMCLLEKDVWYISVMGEYVYFKNNADHCLARIRKDGTDYQVLYWGEVYEINLVEDGIYFSTGESVCRMALDGSDVKEIISGNVWYLNITDDRLYFCRIGDNRALCSCSLDGSGLTIILPEQIYDVMVVGNQIYYTYGKDERYLYAMDKNTFEVRQINTEYTRWINTDYRFIYFTNYEGRNSDGIGYGDMLMRVSLDGTVHKQALTDTIKGIVIQDGRAYYSDLSDQVHSVAIE